MFNLRICCSFHLQ